MARFEIKQSSKLQLTSYSGLALVGQCCQMAQVDIVIDPRIPVSQGMRTSDLVKSMVGLLSLGKSDFEAIEPFRRDKVIKSSLEAEVTVPTLPADAAALAWRRTLDFFTEHLR